MPFAFAGKRRKRRAVVAVDLVLADRAALAHLLDFSLGKFIQLLVFSRAASQLVTPDGFNYKIAMQLLRSLS